MVSAHRTADPLVASLLDHVLTPLSVAERVVETERAEVAAERKAFARFKQRLAGIDTVSTAHADPTPRAGAMGRRSTGSKRVERVRTAYRETVMAVDHYDDVYGEPLDEHAAAELSPDVAATLGENTPFTELDKTTLTAAVERAVDNREDFCDQLDDELASLDDARTTLVDIIDQCDEVGIPARDRTDVTDRLDDVAERRQETIQRRTPSLRADGHDLCQYLYRNQDWTYPVLTAVTRFRNALV